MASNNMSPLRNFLNSIKNSVYNISIDGIGNTDINASSLFDNFPNLYRAITLNDMNYVTNMSRMFIDCSNLINIPNFNTRNVTNMSYMFAQCRNLTNISNLNTINVTNMQRIFQTCYNLKSTINFDTSNVTNMSGAFLHCSNLVNINRLNLNKVTEISSMIGYCNNLSNSSILNIANSLPHYDNIINANKYNTLDYIGFSNNQMSIIANNPTVLNSIENKGWTVQKVKYELAYTYSNNPDTWLNYSLETTSVSSNAQALRNAFRNKDIDTANIVKLNVINLPGVTNGSYLFASNFNKMTNVKYLDMQDLQDASYLFYDCNNLTNASNFNIPNVTDMSGMFAYCTNLINIPHFNTSNVTKMFLMFESCYNLTTIPNFNTINVTNISQMFTYCYNLTTIPNFNTSNVTNMCLMFENCYNLTTIPNFNTSNVTNMSLMFLGCNKLSQTSVNNIVASCANATKVINKSFTNIGFRNSTLRSYIKSAPRYDAAVANGWVL